MLKEHRNLNTLQKYALLLGVFILAALLGGAWLGWNLTIWILAIGALISAFSTNIAPAKMLKWQGAVKLNRSYYSELYDTVNDLASKAGLPRSPDVYMVKGQGPNAFALGTKEKPVIGISHGLASLLNQRQLRGVLAHEISHIKNNDLFIKGLALSFGNLTNTLSLVGKFLLLLALPLYLFGIGSFSIPAVLLLIFSPALNTLLQLALSRSMEFLADHDAAVITRDPMGLASALQRIENVSRPWWRAFSPIMNRSSDWLRSHPETRKRIEKLGEMREYYTEDRFSGIRQDKTIPTVLLRRVPYLWI